MNNYSSFINFFRQSAPYINQHRDKTFVFCIQDSESTKDNIRSILHDIAIIQSLHVKIVIIFGARSTINESLKDQVFSNNQRVTDTLSMKKIQEIIGSLMIRIDATLSMGLPNSSMQGASVQTASGNFITAKPIGIVDGVDFGFTGAVRSVKTEAIKNRLNNGEIVIIAPIGYSLTGEVFNLTAEEVASSVATKLGAEKILFLNENIEDIISLTNSQRSLTPIEALEVEKKIDDLTLSTILRSAARATKGNVKRAHLIQKNINGAIIEELFTRDGFGIMVTEDAFDRIEKATIEDIPSLLSLIRPLEEEGVLVRRSRELLEAEIACFHLLKRDNTVIGCVSLYTYLTEDIAELGCLAVSKEYQRGGRADILLEYIEGKAKEFNINKIFCLTTKTSHWFLERGFINAEISDLPKEKQEFYNFRRGSKPYIKELLN